MLEAEVRGGMIAHLEIMDYQSLRHADLALGLFTVITGPTGSGKSAVIRAVRLLAFNAKGTSYIRHGAARAMSGAGIMDERDGEQYAWSVGIERGGRGKDSYYLAPSVLPGERASQDGSDVRTFTKLGGAVPEEVARALRLTELNFAGQFDRPYLLASTAGDVARKLGELTNVTLVFTAGREAHRRALRVADQVRLREADLAALEQQRVTFTGLAQRVQAAHAAREALARAVLAADRQQRLGAVLGALRDASYRLSAAQAAPAAQPLPSLDQLTALDTRRKALRDRAAVARAAASQLQELQLQAGQLAAQVTSLEQELHDTLDKAGVCPACGQPVPPQQRSA